jgi:hypothetical protein
MTTTDQYDSSAHHVEQPVFSSPVKNDSTEQADDVVSTPRKLANPRRITFSHSARQG